MRNIPRYKVISGEKTHYVLINSHHFVRTLMFEVQNNVLFNYSSIATPIKSTNQQMLTVTPLKSSYLDAVLDNVYDKRSIEVKDVTGTVYIQSESTGYYKKFMTEGSTFGFSSSDLSEEALQVSGQIKDSLRVEIV